MMDYCHVTVFVLFICLAACGFIPVTGNINQKLHYFETLKSTDIHIITKRSIDANPQSHLKFVHLKGLGRDFSFYLRSSQQVLTHDFEATVVDADGHESSLFVDKNAFYQGALQDDAHSHVEAVWEGEDLLATITTPNDTYTVEPSWRHLPNSKNHTMIIYKGSDVVSFYNKTGHGNQLVCRSQPGVTLSKEEYEKSLEITKRFHESGMKNFSKYSGDNPDSGHHRSKRFVLKHDTCDMILVADYTFFKGIGNSDSLNTANYLIHIMSKVDHIYRNTVWDENLGLTNIGVKIRHVKIHSDYSKDVSYNKKHDWEYKQLLVNFSWDTRFYRYCLAHLFTFQKFQDGVLGLAYIASERLNTVGGICSSPFYQDGVFMTLNTGWSSSMNTQGHRILTQEAQIVTAHEIGHNWGSEHDPGEGICSPSSFDNGKFIMYPYAVTGYELNNWKFSPCSRKFINKVLLRKSTACFSDGRQFNFCGNGKVEKSRGEECDGGFLANSAFDHCCTDKCVFGPGAECSPVNHECCTRDCKIASKGVLCRSVIGDASDCLHNSTCTGNNYNCPTPQFKYDNTPCLDGGKCKQGKCLPFCEARNVKSCICDNVTDACMRCCYGHDKICRPYDKLSLLPNGRPCAQGYCVDGVCKRVVRNIIQRFFDVFEKVITDDFGEFMKTNIVTTVIILSMFIWIPASCLISRYDNQQRLKDEEENAWYSPLNRTFIASSAEKLKIQTPTSTYTVTSNPSNGQDRETRV
uniref:Peptidase M12B domain-containing protein n=1 Tax=Octopus bimaculoides TaxID=37653 RepID=A0A0L8FS77_OCTBM